MSMLPILAAADPLEHVVPHKLHDEPLFSIQLAAEGRDIPFLGIYDGRLDFFITNHMLMTVLAAALLILAFAYAAKRIKPRGEGIEVYETPGIFAQLLETICVFIREEVARPNLRYLTDKYIPYIWSVFFLILFANLLGLVPIGYFLVTITGGAFPGLSHIGGTATANLALNGVLAICSFLMVIIVGVREVGTKNFLNHFNPIGWEGVGNKLLLGPMLFLLEWMGLIIKCVVLAMRLFGTMMAGHLAMGAFVGLIVTAGAYSTALGYGVGIGVVLANTGLMLLEIFIALLQAFIFTFLTVLFIATGAVHDHEEHGHDHEAEDPYVEPEVRNAPIG